MENVCTGTQPIIIDYKNRKIFIDTPIHYLMDKVPIDWFQVAFNDGFNETNELFWKWFTEDRNDMEIVHWTKFIY